MTNGDEMREIKFKLWDTVQKKWRDEPFGVLGNGTIVGYAFIILHESRYKLVQYTGLKDKNGKEIYEGDIVKYHEKLTSGNYKEYIGEVEYSGYMFNIAGFYFSFFDYPSIAFSQGTEYIEIIGNIHENPELMEEK